VGTVLLVPVLIIAGFIAIGAPSSWLTLTVLGLAMGMMIFIMASGMAPLFRWGAFVGVSVIFALGH
jgi:branched-chain amino acid transport system permease protein